MKQTYAIVNIISIVLGVIGLFSSTILFFVGLVGFFFSMYGYGRTNEKEAAMINTLKSGSSRVDHRIDQIGNNHMLSFEEKLLKTNQIKREKEFSQQDYANMLEEYLASMNVPILKYCIEFETEPEPKEYDQVLNEISKVRADVMTKIALYGDEMSQLN